MVDRSKNKTTHVDVVCRVLEKTWLRSMIDLSLGLKIIPFHLRPISIFSVLA